MTSNKRPIHVVHYRDDENLIDRRYTYNRMDHTTAETRIDDFGLTDTFLHDSSYRLYGARYDEGGTPEAIREDLASSVYVLDGPGNRRQTEHTFRSGETTTEVYQVNEMNEYTQVGPVDFAHDDNGNLLDDDAHRYGYDYRNRFIKVSRTGDTAPVARYTYDVLDRGRGKWLFDPNAPGADPTRRLFLYDFSPRIVEETGAGGAERGYVYGADPDLPFNMYTTDLVPGGLNSYYLHEIPWRSVVGVTDRMGEVRGPHPLLRLRRTESDEQRRETVLFPHWFRQRGDGPGAHERPSLQPEDRALPQSRALVECHQRGEPVPCER